MHLEGWRKGGSKKERKINVIFFLELCKEQNKTEGLFSVLKKKKKNRKSVP